MIFYPLSNTAYRVLLGPGRAQKEMGGGSLSKHPLPGTVAVGAEHQSPARRKLTRAPLGVLDFHTLLGGGV